MVSVLFLIKMGRYENAFGELILRIESANDKIFAIDFLPELPAEPCQDEEKVLLWAVKELKEYFRGERSDFSVPIFLQGTDFQRAVWRELQKIPYGETVSYGDIAKKIGRPKAARAVGMANHVNKIPIIVPCHRVIGKDGSLTGYAGGLDIKRKLLAVEKSSKK